MHSPFRPLPLVALALVALFLILLVVAYGFDADHVEAARRFAGNSSLTSYGPAGP